jgi:drug/metabolite transporter (DMT)-like permease
LFWGLAFVWIREGVRELTPVNLTLMRFSIAAVGFVLFAALFLRHRLRVALRDIPRLVASGAAAVPAYHISLNFAEQSVEAGTAAILIATAPIFATVLSGLYLDEKVTWRTLVGLVLAFGGVFVMVWFGGSIGAGEVDLVGAAAVIFASLMYAVFTTLAKPLLPKYGSSTVTVLTILTGTALVLPLASGGTLTEAANLSLRGWTAVISLALLSTFTAMMLFFYALSSQTLSRLSVQLYLVPLISVVAGVILLGESVNVNLVVGGAMILLGVRVATSH